MMTSAALPDRQPCLFETLPATAPRRRRGRVAAGAATPAPDQESSPEPPDVPPLNVPPLNVPPLNVIVRDAPVFLYPAPVRVDASALTNPELGDLVRAIGEPSLAFLLVEAVREAKRRLSPGDHNDEDEGEPGGGVAPSPILLRAVRTIQAELADGD